MAGDWIVWVKGLTRKREVIAIAAQTGRSRREVAATLCEFWEWADGETEDGYIPGVFVRILSGFIPDTCPDFWRAVQDAGWIVEQQGGIMLTNFERWMGVSAKSRLKDSQRKRYDRTKNGDSVPSLSGCDPDRNRTEPGPEKRREEKSKKEEPPTPLKKKNAQEKKAATPATIPHQLDTPAFHDSWAQWLAYRIEKKKKLTPTSEAAALKKLALYGPEVASEAISRSIANGWQGLFPESVPSKQSREGGSDVMRRLLEEKGLV